MKALFIAITILGSGCTSSLLTTTILPSSTPVPIAANPANSLYISNVIVSGTTITSSSSTKTASIYFNTSQSTAPLSHHCNTATDSTAKPCLCQYTWIDSNSTQNGQTPLTRTVQTTPTSIQPNAAVCPLPDVYSTEVATNTQIAITLLTSVSNPDNGLLKVNTYNYVVGSQGTTGAFVDASGDTFDNILHYSCYQLFQRSVSIASKTAMATNPQTGATITVALGSQFCTSNNGNTPSGCPSSSSTDFSSQAYYFNLYIRNSDRGNINQYNSSFICPIVNESLPGSNTGQYWPLDQTFSLALTATSVFNVGVEANSQLSSGSDPVSQSHGCFSTTTSSSSNTNSIILSCLGFATQANSDGTCPTITNGNHQLIPTFRLRRYITAYPRLFNASGSPTGAQSIDTIYVLDRPVSAPLNSDPLKPYTMLGPKPCPFAYYDRTAVTGSTGYKSSTSALWAGKNVDGLTFPNVDGIDLFGNPSCSATIPIVSPDHTAMGVTTINKYNTHGYSSLPIRASQPFLPHYEEDINFVACAPQALPLIDAPLHFSRDTISADARQGNVAWCAEYYPTQNPNVPSIDPTPSIGTPNIAPFTSHVSKNTAAGQCSASTLTVTGTGYSYAATGIAYHPSATTWENGMSAATTCDRTVSLSNTTWTRFPLLARSADIESAIQNDYSYQCVVTYDGNSGKAMSVTPSDGCCNANAVFIPTVSATSVAVPTAAHLEPGTACGIPNY